MDNHQLVRILIGTKDIAQDPTLELFPSSDQFDKKLHSFLEEASLKLCHWFATAEKTGPNPSLQGFPEVEPSINSLSQEALLEDLQIIMDGSYQPSHPGALAHLDPPPLTASIIGDLICSGLNNNLLAEELSPSLSKLERNLCKWISSKIGMNPQAGGVAASGGSISNLMGLVLARYKAGLSSDPNAVILVSNQAHVSISRAMKIMGLPTEAICEVPTNELGQISLESLYQQISIIEAQGRKCFAVVATAGTTVRGAIDPLNDIYEFCRNNKIWMHVDAAIGGVFALSDKTKHLVKGIELADSVTINPQKILGITKTSSLLLVARSSDLAACFSTGIPYIEPLEGSIEHGGEIGLQGSRPAEILKLWLGLRQLGLNGINSLLENSIRRRKYFQDKLDNQLFEILSGPLHLICITPNDLENSQITKWSLLVKESLRQHNFMLSRPIYNQKYYLKAVMGNPNTKNFHLDHLADLLNKSI